MRFLKLSSSNLRALEDELDRIGLKHDIEPMLHTMPSPDIFGDDIGFDYGDDDDDED